MDTDSEVFNSGLAVYSGVQFISVVFLAAQTGKCRENQRVDNMG